GPGQYAERGAAPGVSRRGRVGSASVPQHSQLRAGSLWVLGILEESRRVQRRDVRRGLSRAVRLRRQRSRHGRQGHRQRRDCYYDSVDDRSGDDFLINNSEMRYLVGYTQEIARDFIAGVQYYVEQMLDY